MVVGGFRRLSARKCLDNVDHGVRWNGIGKVNTVLHRFAIDKESHVFSEVALIIEHVAAGRRSAGEIGLQRLTHRGAANGAGGALDVALNVLGKPNLRHLAWITGSRCRSKRLPATAQGYR